MEQPFCYFCEKRFFINGAGIYICPYCKKKLVVDKNSKVTPYEKRVVCPHCNGINIVKDYGNYKCSFCRNLFSLKDSKEFDSIALSPQTLRKKEKPVTKKTTELVPPKNNGLAILAFSLSVSTIFMGWQLVGIIGFILGVVSITQIKKSGEKGFGFAIAAIIIGFIWGILWFFISLLLL